MTKSLTCIACKITKDCSLFYKAPRMKTGFEKKCKLCRKITDPKKLEERKAYEKEWKAKNAKSLSDYWKQWNAKNPDKRKEKQRKWNVKNPGKLVASNIRYQTIKKRAYAKWANQDAIKEIYVKSAMLTKETGIQYHVDHIIPLQGELVCGLHVENNLQIITAYENRTKWAKFVVA